MTVTDMVVVGRLGSVELAAVSLTGNLLSDFLLICTGIVSIVGLLVGQSYTAENHKVISLQLAQSLWIATSLSILGMILFFNIGDLLSLFGQDEQVVHFAQAYAQGATWCVLPLMYFASLRSFVSALSQALSIISITVVAVVLNFSLNYVLAFGLFGLPALGITGVGYSTTIVSWSMMIALSVRILVSKTLRKYTTFKRLMKFDAFQSREILKLGLPVAGILVLETGMFSVVSVFMGTLGSTTLAANQIVLTFVDAVTVIAFALGEASTIRVAQELGKQRSSRAYYAAYIAIVLGALIMAGVAVLMRLQPELIVSIFLDVNDPSNRRVLSSAVTLFGIAAIFQIFDGIQAITMRVLKGFKDTAVPMWIGAIGYWLIAVAGGYILCFPFGMGGPGLWWGLTGGIAVTAFLLLLRLRTIKRTALISDGYFEEK